MRRLIRRIVNWAFGFDIELCLILIENRQDNLSILVDDAQKRIFSKGIMIDEDKQ